MVNELKMVELNFLEECDVDKLIFYAYDDQQIQLKILDDDELVEVIYKNPFKGNMDICQMPVNIFMDDTSSNKSKRWKPLHCIQLQLAGLPVTVRQDQSNIKFVSASSEVGILDIMQPIVEDLKDVKKNGILAYDAKANTPIIVTTELALCVCDFSMMAEASNHMGPNTLKFCPRCHAEKSIESYEKGRMRTVIESKRILQRLTLNDSKELRQRFGLKPYENCLWDIINPHSDIPVGNLHWMFLGLGKHLLKQVIGELDDPAKEHLELLLQSADQSSFPNRLQADVIKHIDSRQGKDIKQYIQLAPYHMKIIGLPQEKVKLFCKLAEISNMIMKEEFTTNDQVQLDRNINDYLDHVKEIYPSLLKKVKSHLSTHLVDDIVQHGPPTAYVEDAFEKMHGHIRDQLFQQNQHATSRDTAVSFAEMEILSHVTTGGYFQDDGRWVQASKNVIAAAQMKEIRSFLGKPTEAANRHTLLLTKAERSATRKIIRNENKAIYKGARCQDGDNVGVGDAVLFKEELNSDQESIGIFKEGSDVKDRNGSLVQMVELQIMKSVPPSTNLGFMSQRLLLQEESVFVNPKCLLKKVCLLHDCLAGGCRRKETNVNIRIEQQEKDIKKLIWYHCPRNKFFYFNKFRSSHSDIKLS